MKKNGNFAKRTAASVAALLIVAGVNPATSFLGLKEAIPTVAFADRWETETSEENVYDLATGRPSVFNFSFKSNVGGLKKTDIFTDTAGYSYTATKVTQSPTEVEGEYQYNVEGEIKVVKDDGGNYGNRKWVYFYYNNGDNKEYIGDWIFNIYGYQQYSVNADNTAVLDLTTEKRIDNETGGQSLVEYNDSVLQLFVNKEWSTANKDNQIGDKVKYTKNMYICADVNALSNDSDISFDGNYTYDETKCELFEVDKEGNVIEQIPTNYNWDYTHVNFQPQKPGKYKMVATVFANHVYNAKTKKVERQEFKLVKNFEITQTDINAEDTEVNYGFYAKNPGQYVGSDRKMSPGVSLEVPYNNRIYTIGDYYYSNDYYINVDGQQLEEGVDYEITGDVASKKMGSHTFKVEFIGGYKGEKSFTFTIVDENEKPTISLNDSIRYGDKIEPVVNGNTWDGDVTFEYRGEDDDEYTTTVPTEIGSYQVRAVIGAANGHEGVKSKAKNFSIIQSSFYVEPNDIRMTYGDEVPELTWYTNVDKAIIPDFEVEIWDGDTKIDPAVDKLQAKNYTLICKANDDTKHYSISYYSGTLYVEPKAVKAKDVTVKKNINIFTGGYQSPEFTVFVNGEETPFTLAGQKRAKNVGTYTTELSLEGNYRGYIETEWDIVKKDIKTELAMDINGTVDSKKQIQFILSRNLSDGVSVESGFIYSKTGADITGVKYDDAEAIDGTNIKKVSTPVVSNDGNVTFKVTDAGKGVNIMGYFVYHTASGDFVEYTPVKKITYAQAVNEKVSSGLSIAPVAVKSGNKVTFRVARKAEKMTVLESGFIYSKTGADIAGVTVNSDRIDNDTIKLRSSDNSGNDTSLDFTITDAGKGINVIGFIKYETSNGIQYEYTEVLSTTYAQAAAALK